MLKDIPVEEWHGGNVQRIRSNILHLMRGQLYNIEGYTFFVMGGARSHDTKDGILDPRAPDFKIRHQRLKARNASFRILGQSWWPEELPSNEEYKTAQETLERVNWEVDYVVTHCGPTFDLAMQIGWTQNVVILEAELTMQEHVWYLEQVVALNWSKKVLTENIQNAIHQKVHLDDLDDPCYTVQNDMTLENPVDEDTVSQPVGATPDPDRESDGESIIAGIYLRFENRPSIAECRLRQLRHPDWDGTNRPSGYVLHLWRRFFREDIPPDRVHRPPRNQGRMTV